MSLDSDFHVEVVDDGIVVSLPRSSYSVTYYKPEKSPRLLAKGITYKYDPHVAMTMSEFLVAAWRAGNEKARELGWIA